MPGQATDERSRPPEPLFHFLRNRCSTSSGFRVPLPGFAVPLPPESMFHFLRIPCSTSSGIPIHPRVCGEAGTLPYSVCHSAGPSPRVRGSPTAPRAPEQTCGSIPACAGKPGTGMPMPWRDRVHPRVCGEAARRASLPAHGRGPSPRVRGSRPIALIVSPPERSIPACAGKPFLLGHSCPQLGVHPRVCGEAGACSAWQFRPPGPSPRVRGSRTSCRARSGGCGSIPACAGKPDRPAWLRARPGVHPRVCGEAWSNRGDLVYSPGPSPRVRGSR